MKIDYQVGMGEDGCMINHLRRSAGFTLVEVLVVVVLLLMVGGGVYVWQQSQQQNQEVSSQDADSESSASVSTTPTPQPIPAGWVEHQSEMCDMALAIPPKQDPYTETSEIHGEAFWQVSEGVLDSLRPFASEAIVSARFGYAAGTPTGAGDVVSVSCSQELDKPMSLSDFEQEYVAEFEQNPPTMEKFEGGESVEVTGEIFSTEEARIGNMNAVKVEMSDLRSGSDGRKIEYLVMANNRQYIVAVSDLGWPGDGTVEKVFETIRF